MGTGNLAARSHSAPSFKGKLDARTRRRVPAVRRIEQDARFARRSTAQWSRLFLALSLGEPKTHRTAAFRVFVLGLGQRWTTRVKTNEIVSPGRPRSFIFVILAIVTLENWNRADRCQVAQGEYKIECLPPHAQQPPQRSACESEQQHVVILVRNESRSQLDQDNMR